MMLSPMGLFHSTMNVELMAAKGVIWATAEDLSRNRGRVLSLYRQVLRSLNSPDLPLTWAARLSKKAEARSIFLVASEERSLHNIADLIDVAEYSLSVLRKGQIPKFPLI
ncbi:COMPLEX 1 LYR-like protein [Trema orientale]|uniref:COMPLEX 1 LYR-like protein n=1 Tax=Trema orientale TaxID=63057 RepID=A0A2P5EPM5_TREOI|nr:COMPLEX 1 LYR-like protein [Trema orientale]